MREGVGKLICIVRAQNTAINRITSKQAQDFAARIAAVDRDINTEADERGIESFTKKPLTSMITCRASAFQINRSVILIAKANQMYQNWTNIKPDTPLPKSRSVPGFPISNLPLLSPIRETRSDYSALNVPL